MYLVRRGLLQSSRPSSIAPPRCQSHRISSHNLGRRSLHSFCRVVGSPSILCTGSHRMTELSVELVGEHFRVPGHPRISWASKRKRRLTARARTSLCGIVATGVSGMKTMGAEGGILRIRTGFGRCGEPTNTVGCGISGYRLSLLMSLISSSSFIIKLLLHERINRICEFFARRNKLFFWSLIEMGKTLGD